MSNARKTRNARLDHDLSTTEGMPAGSRSGLGAALHSGLSAMLGLSKAAGLRRRAQDFEQLEGRVLLSSNPVALPSGAEWVDWGGGQVAAVRDAYVLTFHDYLGNDGAVARTREVANRLGVAIDSIRSIGRGGWAELVTRDSISYADALRVSREVPGLRAIEPDRLSRTQALPNDPQLSQQWGIRNTGQVIGGTNGLDPGTAGADIKVEGAWNTTIGSRDTIVAVIDSGVNYMHEDLAANIYVNAGEVPGNGLDDDGNGFVDDVNGYDFADLDSDPMDTIVAGGHGTQVAGVIAAVGNNGIGVTGVAWSASILALKVARSNPTGDDLSGTFPTTAIVAAFDYVISERQRGVNIVAINGSYGGVQRELFGEVPAEQNQRAAIERLVASGGTFVAAAGNSGTDNDILPINYPASYNVNGVISVAATDNDDGLAGFSAFGAQTVDLAAPGVNIRTTLLNGGYGVANGTSFAAPMVSGAIALLKTFKPQASAVELREALINSADPLPSLQGRMRSGGRLNVERALQIIGATGPLVESFSPGAVFSQVVPNTTLPVSTLSVTFNKDLNTALLSTAGVTITGAGVDGIIGNGDDVNIPLAVNGVQPSAGSLRVVNIGLNLSGFSGGRLPVGNYRAVLNPAFFRDVNGNFLNGNTASGSAANISFRVVAATGDNEPNDSLAQATLATITGSGELRFSGATIGNGLFGNRDIDVYRVDLPRGGQLTAEITAKRRSGGSSLDSFIRLFNSSGAAILANDQFFGDDAYIDTFVNTGGTYYIAVSGFGNTNYDVNNPGSGAGGSTGVYDLRIATQLTNDDVVSFTSVTNSIPGQPTLPLNIPRGGEPNPPLDSQTQGVTTAGINVADSRQILDVNVRMNITHNWTGDLRISLIAPSGTEVQLFNRRGGNGQNLTNTTFDDEAVQGIAAASAPYTGSFRPEVVGTLPGLGGFDGQSALGVWTLRIDDTTALHNGQLLSWSLDFLFQNNIFGPFESNDTLQTARALQGVSGTGAAELTAFLGDGGFGSRDRDIYFFEADAGSTFNARVTAEDQFNSVIRLFDGTGRQLLISNPDTTLNSLVDSYVFAQGGRYYLAVSDGNNVAYDPTSTSPNTSNPSLSTGNYTLTVSLAAGVGDGATVLVGNNLTVGLSGDGTSQAPSPTPNNPTATAGWRFGGVDFLPGASSSAATQFFGLATGGYSFTNSANSGASALPMTLTVRSDPLNNTASTVGFFRGLKVQRDITFGVGDSFIAIDVYLTNNTGSIATDLFWMEAFNPDQGVQRNGIAATTNDLDPTKPYASATFTSNDFQQGLTVALAAPSADTRARANVIGGTATVRDAAVLAGFGANDPNGAPSDSRLALSYTLGNLSPGATTRLRYFVTFGTSPAAARAQYDQVENGTGAGHLTATVTGTGPSTQISSASPASETLLTGGSTPGTVPQLAYKLYYPEGFFGDNIYTFVPIGNANDQDTRVVVIARYEAQYDNAGNITNPDRDQIVADTVIAANSRGGITLTTPELFRAGGALAGRPNSAYALEIRSERPVSATFSHYDLALLPRPEAIGESFTNRVSTEWSFGQVTKGGGQQDYVLFYNTTNIDTVVVATFYPLSGGTRTYEVTFLTPGFRRGGLEVNRITTPADPLDPNGPRIDLPDGEYGVVLRSPVALVASVSHYDTVAVVSEGVVGNVGIGSTAGVSAEGQLGVNGVAEQIGVLNANNQEAVVRLNFVFSNGTSYRSSVTIAANSYNKLDVATLPNFPSGIPYGVSFDSNVPVSLNNPSQAFGDSLSSNFADRAYTIWSFGEGFRPRDGGSHPGVTEYLRLYNPSTEETTVEVTISYAGTPGSETFRRTVPARRVTEFNIDQFITGGRRLVSSYFTTTIKAATPIVAYMGHYDRFFPGAFGTSGTPMGISSPVT